MNIYDKIGPKKIASIVRAFYARAFEDPMLAHFFMNMDHEHLVAMQTDFVCSMLGGSQSYRGKPLEKVHDVMLIRPPHFRRRQQILREAMLEEGLQEREIAAWLGFEERLKSLIVKNQASCSE